MSSSDREISDPTLIERVRRGDSAAYRTLHDRHGGSALALARRMSRSPADADDLVAEAFTRVLAVLRAGRGPDVAFRPYLLSTIRRLAYDRTTGEQRTTPTDRLEEPPPSPQPDPVIDGFERESAAAAFSSLPERWRVVLWHIEVEGQTPAEVAELLGMRPNAVAALAYRAREGLRQAYLAEHTPAAPVRRGECRWVSGHLAAYVRDRLTPARRTRMRDHLDECDRCQAAYLELAMVNTAMPALIGVAVLGSAAGAALDAFGTTPATISATGPAAAAIGPRSSGSAAIRSLRTKAFLPSGWVIAGAGVILVVLTVLAVVSLGGRTEPSAGPARSSGPNAHRGDRRPPASPPGAGRAPSPAMPPDSGTVRPPEGPAATPRPQDPPVPVSPPARPEPTAEASSPRSSGARGPAHPTTPPPPATTTTVPGPSSMDGHRVTVDGMGGLVRGRRGVLTIAVDRAGPDRVDSPRFELDLVGARLQPDVRSRQIAPMAGGSGEVGALPGGWSCRSITSERVECHGPPASADSSDTIFLPVVVDPSATEVRAVVHAENVRSRTSVVPVADHGFSARFATLDRVSATSGGNAVIGCPPTAPRCTDNGGVVTAMIDVDDDPSTINSSAATIDVPSGAEIVAATLWWGADLTAGSGGDPAPDPSRRGRVRLTDPSGHIRSVRAERVDEIGTRYQAVADVTALVDGGGRWTVADIQAGTGTNRYGGWFLSIVHRHQDAPLRSIAVLEGFSLVEQNTAADFTVGGFLVPPTGAGSAFVDVFTYEGDERLVGDQLRVGDVDLTDELNPLGNTFNSTASIFGRPRSGMEPPASAILALDIDRIDVTAALRAGQRSTTVRFATAGDLYLTGALVFSIDQ